MAAANGRFWAMGAEGSKRERTDMATENNSAITGPCPPPSAAAQDWVLPFALPRSKSATAESSPSHSFAATVGSTSELDLCRRQRIATDDQTRVNGCCRRSAKCRSGPIAAVQISPKRTLSTFEAEGRGPTLHPGIAKSIRINRAQCASTPACQETGPPRGI